jgi:hypothetical protein
MGEKTHTQSEKSQKSEKKELEENTLKSVRRKQAQ